MKKLILTITIVFSLIIMLLAASSISAYAVDYNYTFDNTYIIIAGNPQAGYGVAQDTRIKTKNFTIDVTVNDGKPFYCVPILLNETGGDFFKTGGNGHIRLIMYTQSQDFTLVKHYEGSPDEIYTLQDLKARGYFFEENGYNASCDYFGYDCRNIIKSVNKSMFAYTLDYYKEDKTCSYYYNLALDTLLSGGTLDSIGFVNSDTVEIDDSGNLIPVKKLYDLEIPKNVNVDVSGKKTTITWEQSDNIDVKGWETEIYVRQTGYTKKEIWSKKKEFDSNWLYADEVLNYQKRYSYNGIILPVVRDYLKTKLGYTPFWSTAKKTDYMIRNKYVDTSAGVIHYSNFVKFDQDNNAYVYYATEVSSKDLQDLIDSGADITSSDTDAAINTDSEDYKGEQTSSFNQSSNVDITDFFNGFTNMIGNIPDLFNKIFSFLPSECLLFIGLGIGVIVILRIFGR